MCLTWDVRATSGLPELIEAAGSSIRMSTATLQLA